MEVIYDNPDEGNVETNDPDVVQRRQTQRSQKPRPHPGQPQGQHPGQSQGQSPGQHQGHQQQEQQTRSSKDSTRSCSRVSPTSSPRRVAHQPISPRRLVNQISLDSGTSRERRRTQSCSSPPLSTSGSPRRCYRGSAKPLNAPSSTVSVTSSCYSSRTNQRNSSAKPVTSLRSSSGRRLSPATLEAARLAVAARAAYAKHRPSRAIEKASFYIVTSEGERRINSQEMEELLARSPRPPRSSRRRSCSRSSVNNDSTMRAGSRTSSVARTDSVSTDHEHHTSGGRRSPLTPASVSSGSFNNSPKRVPRKKRFSASVCSADTVSVRSGPPHSRTGGGEHFQRVRFHSFSRGSGGGSSVDVKSLKSPDDPTSLASLAEQREHLQRSRVGKFGHDASAEKPSVIKFAIAGVVMLAGTCAFLLSYIFGRGETWTLAGSTVMGIGSLLFVLGVCWYLSSTTVEGAEGSGRLEIRVVDQTQLARLAKKGACVQTVTVQTC